MANETPTTQPTSPKNTWWALPSIILAVALVVAGVWWYRGRAEEAPQDGKDGTASTTSTTGTPPASPQASSPSPSPSPSPAPAPQPANPTAVITIVDVSGSILTLNKTYTFSGSESRTPAASISFYHWDFGDGTKITGKTVNHAYKQTGAYAITLNIIDSNKNAGQATKTVTVQVLPPNSPSAVIKTTPVAVNGNVSGRAPFRVTFDARASVDLDNNIVKYEWDFDGDGDMDSVSKVIAHTYAEPGTYHVTLRVSDGTGLAAEAGATIQVASEIVPVAELSAASSIGAAPFLAKLDASGSSYEAGSIRSYYWDFGDGVKRYDAAKVTHTYRNVGKYTAKVTVTTNDDKKATASVEIEVYARLVACFEASRVSGFAPLFVAFDTSCSVGAPVLYEWTFGDEGTGTGKEMQFRFFEPGLKNVVLKVTNAQGATDSFEAEIEVFPER